jgi:uncharacterized RDD family membrane protein YckC
VIKIFHRFHSSEHSGTLEVASLHDRIIAQLIDGIFLSAICSVIIFLLSNGKIYSLWVAPIIPQFLLEVGEGVQTNSAHFWWGGHFFSVHLPYGKDIFLHYPAPALWVVYCLYYFLFTVIASQTPGKMMKRLVILNGSKNSLSISTSFVRWAAYYLSFIPLGLGFWWRGLAKDGKTWHDKICGTQVYQF